MSEIRLFTLSGNIVEESHAKAYALEREVQTLFESNLESLLGVRFVATEFIAGTGNRIDTLGLDENNFPVVVEYKLDKNRTVINQGVAYLVWIKNNQAEFWKAVLNRLGKEVADAIDFSNVRLICVAADFTRDDLGMYELMPSMIDLVRYRRFGNGHILLERITSNVKRSSPTPSSSPSSPNVNDKSIDQVLADSDLTTQELYGSIRLAILKQGDDITEKSTKLYFAFKRTRNFASVVNGRRGEWLLQLHINPDEVNLLPNYRDVRKIGIWGTGQLQIRIQNVEDLRECEYLILKAYEGG